MNLDDELFNLDSPVQSINPRSWGEEIADDNRSIDELFKDFEDTTLPAPLDHATIEANLAAKKKQAESVDPFAISSTDGPQQRKANRRPNVKIDRERLRDPKIGIPHLISLTKSFKPSGKGKEREDLKRLLKMYRLWTHSMYPKGTFRDNIDSVEKLCRQRPMKLSLRAWRDEFSESNARKKAKLDPPESLSAHENTTSGPTHRPHSLAPNSESAQPSNAGLTDFPDRQSPSSAQGPLFRPEGDSEDEFPMEDNLGEIFKAIDQAAAPQPVVTTTNTFQKLYPPNLDDEYAEEEALLREAEAQDDHWHFSIAPTAPSSVGSIRNGPSKPADDGAANSKPASHPVMQPSDNLPKDSSSVPPLFLEPAPDASRDDGHDWDDLYQ